MKTLTASDERGLYLASAEAWGFYKAWQHARPELRDRILEIMPADVRETIRDAFKRGK
jgi:hypothetical protein